MNGEWSCLLDPMRQFAAEPARMLMLRRLLGELYTQYYPFVKRIFGPHGFCHTGGAYVAAARLKGLLAHNSVGFTHG